MPIPAASGPYSFEQAQSYLRDTVVPVRLACLTAKGSPLLLSLWFVYRGGALWCASRPQAHLVRHLERDPRCAFEVARDSPPYRGVRGQGRARVMRGEGGRLLAELLERYLGTTDSPFARRLLPGAEDEVAIRITPARLASWDYTERMQGT